MKQTQTYIKLKDKPTDNYPKMLIIHHSGGTNANPLADTSHHTAKIMEDYHLSRGWEGLGYHYVIQKDGEIWQGRPENYHGAHTTNHNTDSIGICLSGNFDATLPTIEQKNALKGLLGVLKAKYNTDTIVPHRTYANKTCYGNKLSDTWAKELISEVVDNKSAIIAKLDIINREVNDIKNLL